MGDIVFLALFVMAMLALLVIGIVYVFLTYWIPIVLVLTTVGIICLMLYLYEKKQVGIARIACSFLTLELLITSGLSAASDLLVFSGRWDVDFDVVLTIDHVTTTILAIVGVLTTAVAATVLERWWSEKRWGNILAGALAFLTGGWWGLYYAISYYTSFYWDTSDFVRITSFIVGSGLCVAVYWMLLPERSIPNNKKLKN